MNYLISQLSKINKRKPRLKAINNAKIREIAINLMNFLKTLINNKVGHKDYSLSATKEERDNLCMAIINSSSPKMGFYLLLALATFIVTIGILKNNIPLLIGGMLVAPLLSPILSISLSLTILNWKTFLRSIIVFILSAIFACLIAALIGASTHFDIEKIDIINSLSEVDLSPFLISVAAGIAASFTWAKKELNGALSGVAIAVTLLPPLSIAGLAAVAGEYTILRESMVLYLVNVSGIIIGSLIIFLIMGFYKSTKVVISQIELEEKE
ncbi:MAG: TIGR00341 family protein [Candidatus Magasanikbacteria bacterium CG10_big_fil_rev_8_21_14_0_10_40_10]|uniref:TIGR00341 family protein n=1 Tax=Candidatus Magasanikbacteria bacterium CG10_big_fil_rev_8_21_14_0_10_40_10 TaxID=1974648 RepID=A0A2M6W3L9_9BACT|nr:MAG: TIGR00341 family protein [Candidatus Magasanikbacteria bacterium CG10_big_fil_rev_8_21_14_0_10_40_10]